MLLTLETFLKPFENFAALPFDERAPSLDHTVRRFGRCLTGQAFANDECERVFKRGFSALHRVCETAVAVLVFETRRQVLGHAGHTR